MVISFVDEKFVAVKDSITWELRLVRVRHSLRVQYDAACSFGTKYCISYDGSTTT